MNNDKLIYRQVAEMINRAIDDGSLTGRLPSERELASRYRVSRVTVRRAMKLLLDANIVHRLARKGTFVGREVTPVEIAVKRRIGFFRFGSEAMTHYETVLLAGLSQRCGVAGYHLFIESFADNHDFQQYFGAICRTEQPDLCLLSGAVSQGTAKLITAGGIPVILLSKFVVSELQSSYDSCCLDWYNWGYRAARYFISHGYRRLGLITGAASVMKNIEIAEGVNAAHEEDQLIRHRALTFHCRAVSVQAGFDAVLQLTELEYPDAVIVSNSLLGDGVLFGAIQQSDEWQPPIITLGRNADSELNIYPLKYLSFDEADGIKKCWRLLERRLKHPAAPVEAVTPVWKF